LLYSHHILWHKLPDTHDVVDNSAFRECARMTKPMKKPDFLSPFARLFTRADHDAYNDIPFQSREVFGDESAPALAAPTTWGIEAVALMEESAAWDGIPAELYAIEENTVPSWLWQHRSRGKAGGKRRESEGDLRLIFDRAVGSAAAKGWKLGLFGTEKNARAFYDEARHALMQRHIALAPDILASWGLSWAYGIEDESGDAVPTNTAPNATLSNEAIDALTGKTKDASAALWKKLFARGQEESQVTLRLSDIAADWHSAAPNPARAAIDVMALRHNDGHLNIDALRQAARTATVLLDLQDRPDVTISVANIAPLLMALGLAYDSDAGRALVASLTALVTAECTAASAEMAALRGASEEFSAGREAIMRTLRNHRRAVYGDGNDYEKLSVLPAPLPLKNCPDLTLVAEAQRRWDNALNAARAFGLRTTQFTDLTPSPLLSLLMTSASQGLEPMARLTVLQADDADHFHAALHPSVYEALVRLSYPRNVINAAALHIAGAHSLRKAPAINHATLAARGLSEAVLEKIESYLPCVDNLRLAVTPWVVGVDFCRKQLKIPARLLEAPRFDLLHHLGFSDADVDAASLYCYGHGTARNAKVLHLRHRPLFACGMEITAEARIRMAAAVQSFISCDTGLAVTLPANQGVERGAETTLSAWRRGLKSLTFTFDPALTAPAAHESKGRRIKAAAEPHAKPFAPLPRQSQSRKTATAHAEKRGSEKRLRGH
jgi:hypothetical protein